MILKSKVFFDLCAAERCLIDVPQLCEPFRRTLYYSRYSKVSLEVPLEVLLEYPLYAQDLMSKIFQKTSVLNQLLSSCQIATCELVPVKESKRE